MTEEKQRVTQHGHAAQAASEPPLPKRPFAFAVKRAPENGADQWRLFMDEGEAREAAEQLDGDYEALFRVGDRRSAIRDLASESWQPIETAPKDGTCVLVMDDDTDMPVVAFYQSKQWLVRWDHEQFREPTMWAPLPASHAVLSTQRDGGA